jgi:hypothetical protein
LFKDIWVALWFWLTSLCFMFLLYIVRCLCARNSCRFNNQRA